MFPEISQYRKSAVSATSCDDRGEKVAAQLRRRGRGRAGQRAAVADDRPHVVQRLRGASSSIASARLGVGQPVDQDVHPRLARRGVAGLGARPTSSVSSSSSPSGVPTRRQDRVQHAVHGDVPHWSARRSTESTRYGMSSVTMLMTVAVSVQPAAPVARRGGVEDPDRDLTRPPPPTDPPVAVDHAEHVLRAAG